MNPIARYIILGITYIVGLIVSGAVTTLVLWFTLPKCGMPCLGWGILGFIVLVSVSFSVPIPIVAIVAKRLPSNDKKKLKR